MMRCNKHRKQLLAQCMWCGKALCRYCIAKQDGRKTYCAPCASKLSTLGPAKIPKVVPQQEVVMDEDGYFDGYFGFSRV